MEALVNKAQLILEESHNAIIRGDVGNVLGQPLYCKLAELYAEEAAKTPRVKNIRMTHKLLGKLVKRENLNCLVVNLYRGSEGYSLALKLSSDVETETVRLPYEEDDFLNYIDNEQLPPMLLDLLDEANIDIYYSGCVISEIRDHRRTLDASYESRYVLLRPSNLSLAADVAAMTKDKDWTPEERMHLEAEIVKYTAPPLNLCPSPVISIINNKIHRHQYKFASPTLRKVAKRYSQVSINRQKKYEEGPPPKCLRLYDFLSKKRQKPLQKPMIPVASELISDPDLNNLENIDMSNQRAKELIKLAPIIHDEVVRLAKAYEHSPETVDHSLIFLEEITMEAENSEGKVHLTRIKVLQRKSDEVYFGELYLDYDFQEGRQNGCTCKFQLRSHQQVDRYIQQFQEIFTGDERTKSVKITVQKAGQPPKTYFRDRKEAELKQTAQQLAVQQQLHQGLLANINLTGQVPAATPAVTCSTLPQQNVIIVSNGDGVKKPVAVVSAPVIATNTGLIAAQPSQQNVAGQQVVVGRSVNLTNLLNSRTNVATRNVNSIAPVGINVGLSPNAQVTKMAVAVTTTASAMIKYSLPSLNAQLNRSLPTYSQAVSSVKTQAMSNVSNMSDVNIKSAIGDRPASAVPSLQALLADTPSADNPTPSSRKGYTASRETTPTTVTSGSLTQKEGTPVKIISSPQSAVGSLTAVLRTDNVGGGPPPNINIANIASLPGLNVGLQNLSANLAGIQNVQVSIPGLAAPISLSLNVGESSTSSGSNVIISSPPSNIVTKAATSTVTTTSTSVMLTSPTSLQQGQVVHLPISHLATPQLAAQLTKGTSQAGTSASTIPVLQVAGQIFAPVRDNSTTGIATSVGTATSSGPQTVQLTLPIPQTSSFSVAGSDIGINTLVQTSSALPTTQSSILMSKQKVQVALPKQGTSSLGLLLQKRLSAPKRQQQQ